MKWDSLNPPRVFRVGAEGQIELRHCANVTLDSDELITLLGPSGSQYDVCRKSWGYYATPSLNSRLKNHGLRAALVLNKKNQVFVMLVEGGKEADFQAYLDSEQNEVVCWLDTDEAVCQAVRRLGK